MSNNTQLCIINGQSSIPKTLLTQNTLNTIKTDLTMTIKFPNKIPSKQVCYYTETPTTILVPPIYAANRLPSLYSTKTKQRIDYTTFKVPTLTKNGYIYPKELLQKNNIVTIRKDLTVTPKVDQDYTIPQSFKVYKETDTNIIVPKYYGLELFGKPTVTMIEPKEKKLDLFCNIKLRQNQIEIVDRCMEKINKSDGGIISLYTGGGKTVLALHIICNILKLKTLVIVNKTFLLDQWSDRIKSMTNAKIGIIKQRKTDVKDKDIIIGTIQSISMIDYDDAIFDGIDVLIVDEMHGSASKVYSQAFWKICPKYTIGLSATPRRQDGLIKVAKWFLGEILVKISRKPNNSVNIVKVLYESDSQLFMEKLRYLKGKMKEDTVKMTTNLTKIHDRSKLVVDIINVLRTQPKRKILVLSERLKHIIELKKMLDEVIDKDVLLGLLEEGEVKTAFYIGGMKKQPLEVSSFADVIFGTYHMAKEGLDIDGLNTLVMASPKKDIVQSIGRIMRKPLEVGDVTPVVVDIFDNFSCFVRWGGIRDGYYRSNKYTINTCHGFNDKLVDLRGYLLGKRVISSYKIYTKQELIKEYIIYRYNANQYEFMVSEGIDESEFEYESDIVKIVGDIGTVDKNENLELNIEIW